MSRSIALVVALLAIVCCAGFAAALLMHSGVVAGVAACSGIAAVIIGVAQHRPRPAAPMPEPVWPGSVRASITSPTSSVTIERPAAEPTTVDRVEAPNDAAVAVPVLPANPSQSDAYLNSTLGPADPRPESVPIPAQDPAVARAPMTTSEVRAPRGTEPEDAVSALFENGRVAGTPVGAHLWLEDPSSETLRLVASVGRVVPTATPRPASAGVLGAALLGGTSRLAPLPAAELASDDAAIRFAVPLAAGGARGVAALDLKADDRVDQEALVKVAAALRGALTGALALQVARTEASAAKTLLDTASDLSRLIDPDQVVRTALSRAMQLAGAQTGSVMLLDDTGVMHIVESRGLPEEVVESTEVSQGEGIAGWVLASGKPLVIEDLHGRGPRSRRHGVRSAVSVPIADRDGTLGVLNVGSRTFHARFSESHMEALSALGRTTAVALRNARALQTSEDVFYDTLKALAVALESRDPFAQGGTRRVIELTVELGQYLGLDSDELRALTIAAILHDVGMTAAGDLVTVSDRPLSTVEWGMLKMHPIIAAEILSEAPALKDAVPIVYHHHEHFDGTGYVVGLTDGNIPLGARILAVADAFVAMTSDRPYRPALSPRQAIAELKALAGSQFDPAVVDAFAELQLSSADRLETTA